MIASELSDSGRTQRQDAAEEKRFQDAFYREDADRIVGSVFFEEIHKRTIRHLTRLGAVEGKRVLSLGCGDGGVELLAAAGARSIHGVDLSEEGIRIAQRNARDKGIRNVTFEAGDVRELALEPGSFDAVWAIAVLHHFPVGADLEGILKSCRELLAPDGVMVSTDPSARRLVNLLKVLVPRQVERYHSEDEGELEIPELRACYEEAGFGEVSAHFTDFAVGPLAWLVPGLPRPVARLLLAGDSVPLMIPGLRSLASSFAMRARR